MALPTLQRKLLKNDGYGPEIKDERLSTDITVKDWDASHDYPANVLAKAGGDIYRSVAASGPGVAAGAQNPAADDGTYWTALPTNDSNVVHKTGNELVGGVKTFSDGRIQINLKPQPGLGNNYRSQVASIAGNYSRGDAVSDDILGGHYVYDKNEKLLGYSELALYPTGASAYRITAIQNVSSDPTQCSVFSYVEANGTRYFRPDANGSIGLGVSGHRWGQIWSTSSTISTSDGRLKTTPETVPDEVLDAWGDVQFVQFKMLESVAQKGENAARLHSGLIAQRIDEAFRARGLDASRYGLFCWDAWGEEPEERDAKGNVVSEARPAGDMYSLRYEEALCMEAAYQRRRADRAEARIASLEARLAALEAKLNG